MSQKTLNTRLLTRHDTYANWMATNPILLEGELAVVVIPADAGSGVNEPSILLKVGDGEKTFSELGWLSGLAGDVYDWAKAATKPAYTMAEIDGLTEAIENAGSKVTYHTVASVDEMNAIESPKHGDVCVVKSTLDGDKVQYAAYVYDTDKWIAMDGNYSAENVILTEDITMAGNYSQVGNLTKSQNGTATFAVKGKSVAEALMEIFSKRLQPTKTEPSLRVTLAQAGAKEVGTKVTPTYTSVFNAGSYTYGPATGITATDYNVNGTAGAANGTLNEITVADTTNFRVTLSCSYGAGAIAKDNLGSDSNPVVQIAAGSVSANSNTITGYRSFFYGVVKSDAEIDSTLIRSLTNGNAAPTSGKVLNITAGEGAKKIIVALPKASNRKIKEVLLTSSMNLDITATYEKMSTAVAVEGANGFDAVDYDVYVYEPASIGADEVHKITLG